MGTSEQDAARFARFERERALLRAARGGDRAAFGELYDMFAAALYDRVLLPKLGNRPAAEEALAETFKSALEHLPSFDDRGLGAWPWLKRIATNKALDLFRDSGRTKKGLQSFEGLLGPLRAEGDDPSAGVDAAELRRRVALVLDKVNPRYRQAIVLRLFEDRGRDECARALAVTVPTFDVVFLRALRAFKKAWEEEGT